MDYFLIFMTGSSFASFYYLLAERMPGKRKIGWSRSKCNYCHKTLRPLDLIPLCSFLLSRGTCRYCKVDLPLTYPLYELMGGIFLLSVFINYAHSFPLLIFHSLLYSVLFLIAAIDQQYFLIPDRLQLSLAVLAIAHHMQAGTLLTSHFYLAASGMLLISFFAASLVENGLGGGDIKLLVLFGFSLGLQQATFVLFLAALMALLYISACYLFKSRSLAAAIPFGPFLVLAFFFVREVW